jgi:hypothetical protein
LLFLPDFYNTPGASGRVPFCFLHTMLPEAAPDGIRVNTITLAFTLVAGTIVFLRLFTRFVLTKNAGYEDALIAIAMVSTPLLLYHLY